jgi:hypothetical protein
MLNAQSTNQNPLKLSVWGKLSGRGKWILGGCGVLIIVVIIVIAGHSKLDTKDVSNANNHNTLGQVVDTPVQTATLSQKDFSAQLDLALFLEDELGLKEVIVTQDGKNLLVRFKAPTITGDELNKGIVQIFAFVDQKVSPSITTIKLIFTVNHVDSMIVTAQRLDISRWASKKISNTQFIKKFKVVSLLK